MLEGEHIGVFRRTDGATGGRSVMLFIWFGEVEEIAEFVDGLPYDLTWTVPLLEGFRDQVEVVDDRRVVLAMSTIRAFGRGKPIATFPGPECFDGDACCLRDRPDAQRLVLFWWLRGAHDRST